MIYAKFKVRYNIINCLEYLARNTDTYKMKFLYGIYYFVVNVEDNKEKEKFETQAWCISDLSIFENEINNDQN